MSRLNLDFSWYALFSVRGLGPKRLHALHGLLEAAAISPADFLRLPASTCSDLIRGHVPEPVADVIQSLDWETLESDYERMQEAGIRIIHLGHEDYPAILHQRMTAGAPALLFCIGYIRLFRSQSIAIVGSRTASVQGLKFASELAGALALEGKNVISGFAKGVDTEAHLGALRADGTTTIVLSSGIFDFAKKPSVDEVDWERDTLAVSQFHPCDHWNPRNAMTRNKLVCALSQAVVVIEACVERDDDGKMSGTFQTGKRALEMGIPLFIVSPSRLADAPAGNAALIALGGTEFDPESGVLPLIAAKPESAPRGSQPTLF